MCLCVCVRESERERERVSEATDHHLYLLMALLCMIPCSVSTTLLPPNVSIFEAGCDFRDWIEWDYFIWKKNGRHSMKGKEKEMGSMTIILDDSLKALLINLDLSVIWS